MADKFCESCECWEFVHHDAHKKWGACSNGFVEEKLKVTQDFDSVDDASIMTEGTFGCMYHESKGQNVLFKIDIPKK